MGKRASTKASRAVDAMMEKKVDVHKLYLLVHPNMHEKLVLELATEIEKQRSGPDYTCVSWSAQVEAAGYFNEHGFADTLTHMLKLRESSVSASTETEET